MKGLCKLFVPLLASIGLASCGGGGGGSNSTFGPPGDDTTITLSATTLTLPVSPYDIGEEQSEALGYPGNYLGSPYISEVTVTWRHKDGQLVAGTLCVTASVAPTTVIQFSQLIGSGSGGTDCTIPQPTDGDLFHNLEGSGPVAVTAGVGTIFVHAGQIPSSGVLTVTGIDPSSKHTITQQLTFQVAGTSGGLPASIFALAQNDVYVSGSNGPQSTIVSASVKDGTGAFVSSASGVDSVLFEIIGPAGSDARLVATNAAGGQVSGASVATRSVNGIANVTLESGTKLGPVQVRATADRGDNNVDNGVSDPVSATATVVVSDGLMFSIKITNPAVDANLLPVIVDATSTGPATPTPVYAVPVTVIAQDRQGKPVLPGTWVGFGLIDAPVFGFPDQGSGTFELSGNDGNPQEGGTLFTAPTGHFTTAGGGAGPGDALVLFGNEVPNHVDDDLESARTVQHVNNAGSLNVTQPFNLNDTTGVSVDSGNNVPYVIGRASAGNIDAAAFTGVDSGGFPTGVAQAFMRYPQSRIGQSAVVWATGNGANQSNGVAKTVTDAIRTRYLGVGPATLTATPESIFGNKTQTVVVCLMDAVGSPIPGVDISFNFTGLSPATGTINGKTSGSLGPTGASGCIDTTVVTSGVLPGSTPGITYTAGGLSASVTITVGSAILTANPTQITSSAGATPQIATVALTLKDDTGSPVPNATITGVCAGGGSVSVNSPWTTSAAGTATATLTMSGFCTLTGTPPSNTCTFTYANGSVSTSATTTITGVSASDFSPPLTCN